MTDLKRIAYRHLNLLNTSRQCLDEMTDQEQIDKMVQIIVENQGEYSLKYCRFIAEQLYKNGCRIIEGDK